ncbi:MAG: hypothetical protein ACNA78_11155 [Balneolaceae bacterium]
MKAVNIILLTFALSFASLNGAEASDREFQEITITTSDSLKMLQRFETGFLNGIRSDVSGIVEAAIFNALAVKINNPAYSSDVVVRELNRIATETDNHKLRYKAFLAFTYYTSQDQFQSPEQMAELIDSRDQNRVFMYLQNEVQSGLLTSN